MTADPIATARLLLIPAASVAARPSFAEEVSTLFSDPEQGRWMRMVPWPYGLKEGQAFQRFLLDSDASATHLECAILEAADHRFLGIVAIEEIDLANLRGELGYWIRKDAWGRGIATEAATALVAHGFRAFGLNKVTAWVTAGNSGSVHVLEKLGFTLEGRFVRHSLHRGEWVDRLAFGLLREAWEVLCPSKSSSSSLASLGFGSVPS